VQWCEGVFSGVYISKDVAVDLVCVDVVQCLDSRRVTECCLMEGFDDSRLVSGFRDAMLIH